MYFPYFRGKQYELLTIKESSKLISQADIVPIIEPVKENLSSLKRTIKELVENEAEFVLILNPRYGQLNSDISSLREEIVKGVLYEYNNYYLGYILDTKTSIKDINQFLDENKDGMIAFIHKDFKDGKELKKILDSTDFKGFHIFKEDDSSKLYRKKFKDVSFDRILLRDGFKKGRNVDYPEDEHFSDLHATYEEESMDGFGDFLIVGDQYSESGGPAYAVALHLTYIDEDDDMRIKHFISDRTETPTDPAGKFLEALKKLIDEIDDPFSEVFKSKACGEFQELYKRKHFPGLGYVKKLSMKHHIELIVGFENDQ